MVLEDRTEKDETRHYVIDRVHEDTRMLSLIDSDGVLSRVKLSTLSGDWRLFTQSELSVAQGEQLFALAGDRSAGLKARDRLTVTAVGEGTDRTAGGAKETASSGDGCAALRHARLCQCTGQPG
jgi:hypothetical protein